VDITCRRLASNFKDPSYFALLPCWREINFSAVWRAVQNSRSSRRSRILEVPQDKQPALSTPKWKVSVAHSQCKCTIWVTERYRPTFQNKNKPQIQPEQDCTNESPLCHAHTIKPARTFFNAPLRSDKVAETSLLEGRQVLQLLCEGAEQLLAASGWLSPSTAEVKANCRKQLRGISNA
jgi:hypothetical protein